EVTNDRLGDRADAGDVRAVLARLCGEEEPAVHLRVHGGEVEARREDVRVFDLVRPFRTERALIPGSLGRTLRTDVAAVLDLLVVRVEHGQAVVAENLRVELRIQRLERGLVRELGGLSNGLAFEQVDLLVRVSGP